MKKLLFFLFAVLTIQFAAAQQPARIGNVEAIPKGDGTTTFRDADTQVHLEGEQRLILDLRSYVVAHFTNGLSNGAWELFRNNALAEKLNYVDGRLDGAQTYYFSDGTTVHRAFGMVAGQLDGKYVEYFSNGKISLETTYKAGKEEGQSRTYAEDGTLKWDCFYANGLPHGKQTQSYGSNRGDFIRVASFENGVPTGKFIETFTNGTIGKEGQYDKAGKMTGQWIERDQKGKILSDQTYKNGVLEGPAKTYFTDGTVEKMAMYANGNRHGLTTEYHYGTNGQVKSETNFVDGVQQGAYKFYYDTGKLREEGCAEGGETVSLKEYYPDGQLKAVKERRGGVWQTLEKYYQDGTKQ